MSENDTRQVGVREQIDWANDCNDLRLLARSAEAAVRREEFSKAHEKLSEANKLLTEIRTEYPRYIHANVEHE